MLEEEAAAEAARIEAERIAKEEAAEEAAKADAEAQAQAEASALADGRAELDGALLDEPPAADQAEVKQEGAEAPAAATDADAVKKEAPEVGT